MSPDKSWEDLYPLKLKKLILSYNYLSNNLLSAMRGKRILCYQLLDIKVNWVRNTIDFERHILLTVDKK